MKTLCNDFDESTVLENARCSLTELFGAPFSCWALRDAWQPVDAESSVCTIQPDQIAASYLPDKPQITALSAAESLVVIPIETTCAQNAAVAIVPAHSDDYWERLARAAHRTIQQDRQLDHMEVVLKHLSESMEESTWMRGLFQSVQSCEATQSVAEVAELMLPKLSALIQARSVGFLPFDGDDPPIWTDRRGVPSSEALISNFPARSDHRAVIFNASSKEEERQFGLHSLILAPVRFRGYEYGCVAAIDCRADLQCRPDVTRKLSEYEFGTEEATLVEAAAAMLATHCRNASLLQAKERLVIGVIRTLGGAVDARDPYTKGHSDRVALYAREIAREMGMNEAECQRIYVTGLLHDVGKIGVPDAVLKKPGKLTYDEYEIIKNHARQGHEILKDLADLAFTLPGVLHHHERVDGRGYPCGIAGDEIPLVARIMSVADAYDAMTSCRAYRQSMSFEKAEQIVRENIGTQFDPQAAAAFLRVLPRVHEIAGMDARRCMTDNADAALVESLPPVMEIDSAIASVLEA